MNLQFMTKIFNEIFSGQIAYLVIVSKAIGCLLVIITLSKAMMKSFAATGKAISKEKDGFSPDLLYRSLGLLMVIGFSTEILSIFDSMLSMIEGFAFQGMTVTQAEIDEKLLQDLGKLPPEGESVWGAILRNVQEIAAFLNPLNLLTEGPLQIVKFFVYLIDLFIYPLFLAKRFFIMGVIKIFVPLMIALSIYDKTKDYIHSIFKLYARSFLVIIPFMFVTLFVNQIVNYLIGSTSTSIQEVGVPTWVVSLNSIEAIVLIFAIILKIKLYKESYNLMDKIIP